MISIVKKTFPAIDAPESGGYELCQNGRPLTVKEVVDLGGDIIGLAKKLIPTTKPDAAVFKKKYDAAAALAKIEKRK